MRFASAFALALAQRAFQDPRFEWATEPAPRSYWRGKGASFIAKLAYPLVIFGLWLSLVWLVGAVPRWLTGAWAWLFGEPQPPLQAVTDVVSKASEWVLGVSIRGVGALIALGLLARRCADRKCRATCRSRGGDKRVADRILTGQPRRARRSRVPLWPPDRRHGPNLVSRRTDAAASSRASPE